MTVFKKRASIGRRRTKTTILATALATTLLTSILTTDGLAQGSCEPFSVVSTGDGRTVEYIDHGAPGSSLGDQRIGVRVLTAEDGSPAGTLHWVLTVMHPQPDGTGTVYLELTFFLPDGELFTKGIRAVTNAPEDTARQSTDRSAQTAIIGGTGAYAGARGTYEQFSSPNGIGETYVLDISCD